MRGQKRVVPGPLADWRHSTTMFVGPVHCGEGVDIISRAAVSLSPARHAGLTLAVNGKTIKLFHPAHGAPCSGVTTSISTPSATQFLKSHRILVQSRFSERTVDGTDFRDMGASQSLQVLYVLQDWSTVGPSH